ncbi:MAG TPA: glycosyltransferase family 9 protein, partial [Deltaproteobacteria bacterium]|nr:glycosyltransferase family 9 protein [Deltaproteobacteria bacterium]
SVNPFSRWSYKEWDAGKWREVISFIWREYHLPAVIVGSVEEQKRAEILISDTASPVINLTGRTNLRELAALLKMSKLHIGVDSAPPHIAAAVGTPNLTIYGPSDWRDWVLPDKKNQVVVTDMPCSPCYQKGCDGSGISKCLEDITADTVTANVRTIMDALIYQA